MKKGALRVEVSQVHIAVLLVEVAPELMLVALFRCLDSFCANDRSHGLIHTFLPARGGRRPKCVVGCWCWRAYCSRTDFTPSKWCSRGFFCSAVMRAPISGKKRACSVCVNGDCRLSKTERGGLYRRGHICVDFVFQPVCNAPRQSFFASRRPAQRDGRISLSHTNASHADSPRPTAMGVFLSKPSATKVRQAFESKVEGTQQKRSVRLSRLCSSLIYNLV